MFKEQSTKNKVGIPFGNTFLKNKKGDKSPFLHFIAVRVELN